MLSEYPLRLFNRQEQHVRMRVSSGVIDLHSSSPLEQKNNNNKKQRKRMKEKKGPIGLQVKSKVLQWVVKLLTTVASILKNRLSYRFAL